MSNNQPPYDPLNPTTQEDDDIFVGYREGFAGVKATKDSLAYAHGRRNGSNGRAKTADPEQLALAARMRREAPKKK